MPDDLIVYLDPSVSETAGVDLFEGPPPELTAPTDNSDPSGNLVALTHFAGDEALDRVMGASLTAPGVEVALIQLFVRNESMVTAKSKADAYHALLDGLDGTLSSRTYFNVESQDSMPYTIGQDDRGLYRYVCNFRVEHGRSGS